MVCYYLVMHKEGQDFWSYLEILDKEIHAEIEEGLLVFFSYIYCQLSGNPTFFVVTEICYFNFGLSNINQVISSETGNNAGCKSLIYF